MENHRLKHDYLGESDKLRRKSFRTVGLALGGVNAAGGALLSFYVMQFKDEAELAHFFIPIAMLIVGLMTLLIRGINLKEKTKLLLYSINYILIPFNLYVFIDEAAAPFWVLTFLYVTLAFALQSRFLVINSIIASLAGLLFLTIYSPSEVFIIIKREDHMLRLLLFIIFVSYVLWGLSVSKKKENLLFHYMNQAENAAYENPLFNMPNQLDFHLYIDHEIQNSELIIIKIEVKDFQSVYDVLGQSKSDELLQLVKRRLMDKISDIAYLAKGEGGQFLAAIKEDASWGESHHHLKSLLEELSKPYSLKDFDYILIANIGLADSRKDGQNSDELMRNAQFALNKAKEMGMNQIVYCTNDLKLSSLEKINISDSLYRANLEEEFYLVYQPQLNLNTGRMTGVEVLIRWNHPEKGFIPPGTFIDIAEKNGFIVILGSWILRKACKDIQQLNAMLDEPLKLAVNVSVVQIQELDFVEKVLAVLKETGLAPELLEIELTERTFLENQEEELRKIRKIQSHGISIAIDDFGTGYSSFEVLKRVKIDKIKVPREFIDQVDKDVTNQYIVETVISMANRFGITCLAEGIEHQNENKFLIEQGCEEAQGYYYSKPIRINELQLKVLNLEEEKLEGLGKETF